LLSQEENGACSHHHDGKLRNIVECKLWQP
jgi:hypothetical protein